MTCSQSIAYPDLAASVMLMLCMRILLAMSRSVCTLAWSGFWYWAICGR